jgi:hypothetical protein
MSLGFGTIHGMVTEICRWPSITDQKMVSFVLMMKVVCQKRGRTEPFTRWERRDGDKTSIDEDGRQRYEILEIEYIYALAYRCVHMALRSKYNYATHAAYLRLLVQYTVRSLSSMIFRFALKCYNESLSKLNFLNNWEKLGSWAEKSMPIFFPCMISLPTL